MICASTRAEALAKLEENRFVDVTVTGSPADCIAGMAAVADNCGVDEVMIFDLLPDHGAELSTIYSALARLAGLEPRGLVSSPVPQHAALA
jgi:alkanesulfonate monooxygenase SsuD/methylene tetrahydromethanopterin reductase-like flavin-dependent oxidoreductase (luciferase family)